MGDVTRSTQNETEGLETLWVDPAGSRKIKAWRKSVGWSAAYLGRQLGVSRSYVKHLESPKHPWVLRRRVARRLDELIRETKAKPFIASKPVLVFSRYKLAAQLYLSVRPRRCRGHRRLCAMSANQVYCGSSREERAECERIYRRRERKKRKELEDD